MTILGNLSEVFGVYSVKSRKAAKVYDQGAGLLEYNALSVYKTPNYIMQSLSSE